MERIEQTIRRNDEKASNTDKVKYRLLFALSIATAVYAFFGLIALIVSLSSGGNTSPISIITVLICGILAAIFFTKKDDMILEYDYIVEDDVLTVSKIKNLKSRKDVLSVPVSSFKRIEPYSKERFSSLTQKKYDFSLNGDTEKLILFFTDGSSQAVLAFEPDETLLNAIKKELLK